MKQTTQILEWLGTKLVMIEEGMYMQKQKTVAIPRQEVPWVKGWFTLTKANSSQAPNIGTTSYLARF